MTNKNAMNPNDFIWAQKYRPKTVTDCILPDDLKSMIQGLLEKKEIPHFLFSGGPGCGKTTLAYAIASELGSDAMYINASLENGIDVLRTKIQSFASSFSMMDSGPKIVILDEADGLTGAIQGALKGFLEAFSANCRFVFTANHKNKIIEPIHSRCTVIDFRTGGTQKAQLAAAMLKRIRWILENEGVTYDTKVVVEIVKKSFPDFRKTLNVIQKYATNGTIDSGALASDISTRFEDLFGFLKDKNFAESRKWVARNSDIDTSTLFRAIYDQSLDKMQKQSIPQLVLILADYQFKASFVADPEINIMACLTEVMSSCQFEG